MSLPDDVLNEIFNLLDPGEKIFMRLVCKDWNALLRDTRCTADEWEIAASRSEYRINEIGISNRCTAAARGGNLELLKQLRSHDPPYEWNMQTCMAAAREGQLDTLKWMLSQDPPCPWNEYAFIIVVETRTNVPPLLWYFNWFITK